MTRTLRHHAIDRIIHWLIACAMLALLATGLLPQMGIQFEWLLIHWVTGLALALLIVIHLLRVWVRRGDGVMRIRVTEIGGYLRAVAGELRGRAAILREEGKYSLPQKVYHHGIALLVIGAALTGIALLFKIDTPFWERDPYWLPAAAWGAIYVTHDLVALLAIPALMLHIYFAARPEKRHFTRAMVAGYIDTSGNGEERSE